jgi:hypothetical protein
MSVTSGDKWRGFGLFRETDDAGERLGQAPSELALHSAGFTPLAFANALRIGSSSPVSVAGLLRREPRIAPWSTDTTPSRADTEPCAHMRE